MEFVDYHVGAPVIAENADSKNKFIRKLEKGLETFQYQAPLSHKLSFIRYKQSFAKKYDYMNCCDRIPQIEATEKYLILYAYAGRISIILCFAMPLDYGMR